MLGLIESGGFPLGNNRCVSLSALIRLWEAVDGEGIFRGYAPAGYRAGGKWCFTAEAGEHYEVSPSTAVIWVKCFRETGQCAAKPRGGSTSPLEKHANFLLALIEVEPDLTLDGVVCAMRKHKIPGSRTAVWRLFQRHNIAFRKKLARSGAEARGRGTGTPTLEARTRPI